MRGTSLPWTPLILVSAHIVLGCGSEGVNAREANSAPQPCEVDECSFDVTRKGNEAKKAGDFERALEMYLRCPERNFPNLVGLAEAYEPTRTALHELEQRLKEEINPPALSADVNLLLRIQVFLSEKMDIIELHNRYLERGLPRSKMASTFAVPLLRAGAFKQAEVYEHLFRERLRTASDDVVMTECAEGSDEALIFGGAIEDYARLLVGRCRTREAACLTTFGSKQCPSIAIELDSSSKIEECNSESHEPGLDCDTWLEGIVVSPRPK